MKTATVRQLRNEYAQLMRWVGAGEEIAITCRGKRIARLIPDRTPEEAQVDWSKSAAVRRDRRGTKVLTAEESKQVLRESAGSW